MYLKKIIAQGFKSFADKIVIDLNDDITAIVGPNGSGKSNVVDAIRWVLGEQSVKSLRGEGNMTDVIFQGSKSRSASNIASVTLIFDNTDKYINLNYSEISIKRRVYKDGTNEYYLNGSQCRLKDITNILLDSGMAKESFNIISQGQIDEIILSKPIDRKVMIEEAAGVLKYKRRKEDALRKLEKTNDNINRVNDIINELENQVEPLKVEREKALKYVDLGEELKNIEVALISRDITNLNYKYQDKRAKIDILNNEIVNITSTNTSNEAKILDYKVRITNKENEIKEMQGKLLNLIKFTEELNGQKKIILERKKYQVDDQKLHENIVNLKERQLKLSNEVESINNVIENVQKQLREIDNNIVIVNNEIKDNQDRKQSLQNSLSGVVRKNLNIKQNITNIQESIDNNDALPLSVRKILNNIKLTGIHNVLGSLLEVDEVYSKAITVCLGAGTNNIIVDNEKSAKMAIIYLKENNLGRTTFLPMSVVRPKYVSDIDLIKDDPSYIDIASNLVKYDKKYENVILNQLGNIIVVKDIDGSNRISKKINYRYRVVTLDGEVINVGGSITGGKNKVQNIISLKYDLENLIVKQKSYDTEISNIENEINKFDYELKSLEDKLYLLNKDKININELLITKHNVRNDIMEQLEDINRDLQGTSDILDGKLSVEEENIIKKYYNSIKEKNDTENIISLLENEKNDIQEEKERFEYQVKRENALYNSKNKELKELEIEVNRLDVKLDTLLNSLNENYNMTYEKAVNLYKLELDEEMARNKVNSLKRELKEIGDVNLNAPKQYEEISVRYEFLIKQREDLVCALNTLRDIIKEMDNVMICEFVKTFDLVNKNFGETFKELFRGGKAELKLTDPDNILETGIDIVASPPGKKLKNISLLSGGEKTFTAISLLFAILKSRSVPFCVLDEVEAALDEVNVDSFGNYIQKLKNKTQFIIITHKKKTMEFASVLYGITMQESGVSKLVSVKLEDVDVK
ncbi:MAG: AAA family ATPase [Bacilli bacterium]|nr:AAA family ATPase [Bacilli bacterium]